ncbi:porin [Escherichia coli]|uniref:porin n=1 Tax=Escherichia coli TaxID=562 RepID=UPI00226525C7|nr:porin [Escherichia coli]
MKVKVLSLLVPALLVAGAANAAEIYNKDGNKLDLYGKVDGLHYFSDNDSKDGDKTYMRLGFKGETQVTDQLTGYGQWEYQIQGNEPESDNSSWTRVAFAGLKFQDVGSFDYGRNYGVVGRGYDDEDILKYVDVGATYYFNKNMSTYVDYKINLLDDNQFTRAAGINTDDIVALGLVYQF